MNIAVEREVKERPILFSTPMVQALLEGRKTQTRRIIKPQPPAETTSFGQFSSTKLWTPMGGDPKDADTWTFFGNPLDREFYRCPYGDVGDSLWVRETYWHRNGRFHHGGDAVKYADEVERIPTGTLIEGHWIKRPSIHMPRWASRLTLEITEVRVERLQSITPEDGLAEGVQNDPKVMNLEREGCLYCPRELFADLWESIHGLDSWTVNPWVWVITFRRVAA